jgi:RimJ/RimL family protein N-acetyltransferase
LKVIETARLTLRWLSVDDAAFIVALLNDPAWLRFIGDKGVRSHDDARRYILNGPVKMYAQYGFGLYLTELKDGVPIGLCGLIKREGLEDVDVGFAFLPEYRKNGYALESAAAVIAHGENVLRLSRIVAITAPANGDSVRLLEKLGLRFERNVQLPNDTEEIRLYARDVGPPTFAANAKR